jgi:hypothetical protein
MNRMRRHRLISVLRGGWHSSPSRSPALVRQSNGYRTAPTRRSTQFDRGRTLTWTFATKIDGLPRKVLGFDLPADCLE